jgi:nitroreductase
MIKDLITKSRSYRRFFQEVAIDRRILRELVELATAETAGLTPAFTRGVAPARTGRANPTCDGSSPSAANLQPLKYILCCEPEKNALIFQHLAWAGYLKDWPGPADGERPSAYIIILGDTEITRSFGCDHGIAAQSILLGAAEKGLGGCIIGTVKREELRRALALPARYEILLILALGKPKETVVIEPVGTGGDIKYWRDNQSVHHVPKRSLDGIILIDN